MLRIVGIACAVGDDRGTAAFVRRIYAGDAAADASARATSLQELFAELVERISVETEDPLRVGGIVLGDALDIQSDDLLPGPYGEPNHRSRGSEDNRLELGTDAMTARFESTALVEALQLAARWLDEDTADLVLVGTEGDAAAGALLLASRAEALLPTHAVIAGVSGGAQGEAALVFRRALADGDIDAANIGLLESVSWPPAAEVVGGYRGGAWSGGLQDGTLDLTCAAGGPGSWMPAASPLPLLSLIKAALCVERRMWVPTPVDTTGSPVKATGSPVDITGSPVSTSGPPAGAINDPTEGDGAALEDATSLFVVPDGRPWMVAPGDRRIADVAYVASERVGHILVTEADRHLLDPLMRADLYPTRSHLVPVMGGSLAELVAALDEVRTAIVSGVDVSTIAARQCRSAEAAQSQPYALALVGRDREELLKELDHADEGLAKALGTGKPWQTPRGSAFAPEPLGAEGVTFVYPGVFNSYAGLARDLFQHFPWLQDDLTQIVADPGALLAERWLYPRRRHRLSEAALRQHNALLLDQPEVMIESGASVAIAHTRVMRQVFGVKPRAALGYSMGEVSMLWAAGVWQDADAGSRKLHASPLFRDVISGPKLAIRAHWGLGPEADVNWATYLLKAKIDRVREVVTAEDRVYVTFVNLDNEVVIAGEADACQRVVDQLNCHALPVPASVAIHNEAVQAARDEFVAIYTHPVVAQPDLTFYSAAAYAPLQLTESALAEAMATMCCQPVDFPRLVTQAYADGARVFLELGPLATCTRRIKRILRNAPHAAVAVNPSPGEELDGIVRALAVLVAHRVPVSLTPLYAEEMVPAVRVMAVRSAARAVHSTAVGVDYRAAAVDDVTGVMDNTAPATLTTGGGGIAPEAASGADRRRVMPALRRASPEQAVDGRSMVPELDAAVPAPATSGNPESCQAGHAPVAGLIDLYGRHLLPQQARAAEMHRAFLLDRQTLQHQSSAVIGLQVDVGRRLLRGSPEGGQLAGSRASEGRRLGGTVNPAARDDSATGAPFAGTVGDTRAAVRVRPVARPQFDEAALREFASGDVTRCFGADFAVYRGRRLPRIPNGDLLLMSRVMSIEGEPGVVAAPAALRSEFDVAPNAWYYADGGVDRSSYPGLPPYVVLMEMALQPCGFLSAYLRSSLLNPEGDLYFRNLDGHGRVLADLDLRGKTVSDHVQLLSSTRGQGVIIQSYTFSLACEGIPFYEGWSSFGYFPLPALQRQVGLDATTWGGDVDFLAGNAADLVPLPRDIAWPSTKRPLVSACAVQPPADPGAYSKLLISGDVGPEDWYFHNHFYEDPVMPGSLGVEAGLQAMLHYARWRYPALAGGAAHQVVDHQMTWKYRGQITPEDLQWREEIALTDVHSDGTSATLVGDVTLWKGDLPIYRVEDAAVRLDA